MKISKRWSKWPNKKQSFEKFYLFLGAIIVVGFALTVICFMVNNHNKNNYTLNNNAFKRSKSNQSSNENKIKNCIKNKSKYNNLWSRSCKKSCSIHFDKQTDYLDFDIGNVQCSTENPGIYKAGWCKCRNKYGSHDSRTWIELTNKAEVRWLNEFPTR